jgi:hypothetical protein
MNEFIRVLRPKGDTGELIFEPARIKRGGLQVIWAHGNCYGRCTGIGRGIAHKFAANGASVCLLDISRTQAETLAGEAH